MIMFHLVQKGELGLIKHVIPECRKVSLTTCCYPIPSNTIPMKYTINSAHLDLTLVAPCISSGRNWNPLCPFPAPSLVSQLPSMLY